MTKRLGVSAPTPTRRLLRAFAFDPMSTRLTGRFLNLDIPFEEDLAPGPSGELVNVVDFDQVRQTWYRPVDLNDPFVLAQQGLRPSESDPRTHQQIAYAVAMSVVERFERFGGRRFRWIGNQRLILVPHAFEGRNAYFDPDHGAVLFGYFRASAKEPGANLPGQLMFTCLSVDIIAHEVTHALVHRIRPQYQHATNPDVHAWHEAVADLVALFHHFLFREVVADAIAGSEGELGQATALFELASEFGESTGRGEALRSAIGSPRTPDAFINATEPHERGACFVAAVFDAFLDTYRGSIGGLRRLATGGSGILPPGALPPDLVNLASREAVRCADLFLGMVVRAFEFLPVVDVTFGDVVKAIVTADRMLFPDDEMRLRATLVEALRRRGIRPHGVTSLADEALTWEIPKVPLNLAAGPKPADLSLVIIDATRRLDVADRTNHGADLTTRSATRPADPRSYIGTQPPQQLVGLTSATDKETHPRAYDLIASSLHGWAKHHAVAIGIDPDVAFGVAGFHVAYLQAADGQTRPIVVVQLLQRRKDLEEPVSKGEEPVRLYAGTTLIARVNGEVLYLVAKPLPSTDPAALPSRARKIGFPAESAQKWHDGGMSRLEALRNWVEQVEREDPQGPWTTQAALKRMTFAQLHSSFPDLETAEKATDPFATLVQLLNAGAATGTVLAEQLRSAANRAKGN